MKLPEWIPAPIRRHPRISTTAAVGLGLFLLARGCPDETVEEPSRAATEERTDVPTSPRTDDRLRDFLRGILGTGSLTEMDSGTTEGDTQEDSMDRLVDCLQVNGDVLCTRWTPAHMSCMYTGEEGSSMSVQIVNSSAIQAAVWKILKKEKPEDEALQDIELGVYVGFRDQLYDMEGPDFDYSMPAKGKEDNGTCEGIRDILYNPVDYEDLLCEGKSNCDPKVELRKGDFNLGVAWNVESFTADLESVGLPFVQSGVRVTVELSEGPCTLESIGGTVLQFNEEGKVLFGEAVEEEWVFHMSTQSDCPEGVRGFSLESEQMIDHLLSGGEAFEAFDPPAGL